MELRPLDGFVVGVTADRRAAEQAELLRRRGAHVLHGRVISTAYLVEDDGLRRATQQVIAARPAYLLATTGIGMRAWFEVAQSWALADALAEALAHTKVLARGPKASSAVQAMGLRVWGTATDERLASLVDLVVDDPPVDGSIVVQRHGGDDVTAHAGLYGLGVPVVEVVVYRWELPEDRRPAERLLAAALDGRLDALTFTSAPAVRNLFEIAADLGHGDALQRALKGPVLAVCVGPVCAEAARAAGVPAPLVSQPGRLGSMVRALTDGLAGTRRTWTTGGVTVTWQGRTIVVGDRRVTLSPRERLVLQVLAERPGVVVPRARLRHVAWPGRIVGDHVVETAVARLRRTLGAAAGAVQVVPRRGYRLVVDEGELPSDACPSLALLPPSP